MDYYLRIEAVNLAWFIDDTQDLSTIRGGGLLLLEAVKKENVQEALRGFEPLGKCLYLKDGGDCRFIPHGNPLVPAPLPCCPQASQYCPVKVESVSTGASAGLYRLELPDDETTSGTAAKNLREAVDQFFRTHEKFRHATFVVDVLRSSGDFKHDRALLLAMNRWRQLQRPSLAVPGKCSYKYVCIEDQVRPSADAGKTSESVLIRKEYGQGKKQTLYHEILDKNDFMNKLKNKPTFTHDFDELSADPDQGHLHYKMAVLYLDGNGFGRIQDDACPTPSALSKFDTAIKQVRDTFMCNLLLEMEKMPGWRTDDGRNRVEVLLWGGDELILVVPAWQGWNALCQFYQSAVNRSFADHPLTYAAGLVFCHHNAPIHRLKKVAQHLADFVKEQIKKLRDPGGTGSAGETGQTKEPDRRNAFAYVVLESFDHTGLDPQSYLRQRLPAGEEMSGWVIRGSEMADIEKEIHRMREILPHRKVVEAAHQLANNGNKVVQPAGAGKENPAAWLDGLTDEAKTIFGSFAGRLGSPRMALLHLAELWDYVGVYND